MVFFLDVFLEDCFSDDSEFLAKNGMFELINRSTFSLDGNTVASPQFRLFFDFVYKLCRCMFS